MLKSHSLRVRVTIFVLLFSFTIILAGSIPYVWDWINRPISVVNVSGDFHHLSKEQLKVRLSSVVTTHFFDLKLADVKNALLSLPWISQVELRKIWPGTLWVKLYERKAVARWNQHALIDTSGAVFMPANINAFKTLPLLQSNSYSEKDVWNDFLWLHAQLSPFSLSITGFKLDSDNSWSCILNGVKVMLGNNKQHQRVATFKELYIKKLKPVWANIKQIDLRYSDGAAVAWRKNKQ